MTNPPTLEARLARVEYAIAALSREIAAIRAEHDLAPGASAADHGSAPALGSTRAPEAKRPPRHLGALDFERLLGRYGMLGIAVFAAVAAVGTFLSWAVSHGYLQLGPGTRVVLGLAFAVGIGAWGVRLRRRERSFGSSLLGLALVIVLVCAYAAGPGFQLVPTWLAFIGSAGVAWALAIFARGQDDEPLWCVAFGGAAIAPFVTSDGRGNLYALLAYGLVLLLSACFAISHRVWPVAWRVFYLSSALFVVGGAWLAAWRVHNGFYAVFALPLVIGAAGILPFAPDARKRAALRWLALLALLATVAASGLGSITHVWLGAAEMLCATGLWLLIVDRLRGVEQSSLLARHPTNATALDWIDVAGIPLALAFRAGSIAAPSGASWVAYALAALLLVAVAWRRPVSSVRDAAAFAFMVMLVAVVGGLPLERPLGVIATYLGIALVALVLLRLRPSMSWIVTGAAVLAFAITASVASLVGRAIYAFTPFGTEPSATALAVGLTLVVVARGWRGVSDSTCEAMHGRPRRTYADRLRSLLRALVAAPWIWAFSWILIEIAMAYSPSTSTLLLVVYFAATAVVSVAAGRMIASARLRQIGLFLAVAAAATSVYGASNYFGIGARVVAYLVTSAFLLGIAYWYRQPGPARAAA